MSDTPEEQPPDDESPERERVLRFHRPERVDWIPPDAPDVGRQGAFDYNPSADPLDNPTPAVQLQPGGAIGCARALIYAPIGLMAFARLLGRLVRRVRRRNPG